ncbi:hypothetical protein C1H46_044581 [Malus baccata]|uniref:Uncharacterized protein n=1 Tax=Malus baccata TaxID=106549 RepID=A0A540K6N7_MALBA|nr:hypothetical protein C1H46_044581 [Malus baccata]
MLAYLNGILDGEAGDGVPTDNPARDGVRSNCPSRSLKTPAFRSPPSDSKEL